MKTGSRFVIKNKEMRAAVFLSLFSILAVSYYIFTFSRGHLHSDTASTVLLANEQHISGEYFPEGFCYSTGIFIIGLQSLISGFLFFIKDWVLCREAAQFLQTVFLCAALYFFFTAVFGKKKGCIGWLSGIILFVLPLSDTIYDLYYYQAVYMKGAICLLLIFGFTGKFLLENQKHRKWIWFLAFAAAFLSSHLGIRNIMLVGVPFMLAAVICAFDPDEKRCRMPLDEKRILGGACAAMAAGLLAYKLIERYVGWQAQTEMAGFIDARSMAAQTADLLMAVFEVYGVGGSAGLISLESAALPFKMLYMLACVAVVPAAWLVCFPKIKNRLWKWFVCYSWISNLFMLYLFLATTAGTGELNAMHILPVYMNNTLLFAGMIVYAWENRAIQKAVVFMSVLFTILVHAGYIAQTREAVRIQETEDEELLQYLEANGLDFGYATYWNAYKYTMLTSGRIQILAYAGEPVMPFYWLTSKRWYEPDYHTGRSFVLLGQEESVDAKYYRMAERVDRFGRYTVLVYEKNLCNYPQLSMDIMEVGEQREIPMDQLHVFGRAYKQGEKILLEEGGMQFGPYIGLEGGKYQVRVEGSGLSGTVFEVSVNAAGDKCSVDMRSLESEQAVYQFSLDDYAPDVELLATNKNVDTASVEKVTITCLERHTDALVFYSFQLPHTDRASFGGGKIVLEEGGTQFGPYLDLEAGIYRVKVYGLNLTKADYAVTEDEGKGSIEIEAENIQAEDAAAVYTVCLKKPAQKVEFLTTNRQQEEVVITRLSIQKMEDGDDQF